MPEIISRKEAMGRGLKSYFTGKSCRHGHMSGRRCSTGHCLECSIVRDAEYKRNNRQKARESSLKWYRKNRDKKLEDHRVWTRQNLEHLRVYQRERYARRADLIAALREEMPELLKEAGL